MKPPFTYFGGKTAIAGQIADLLPPHEHYVEPFAGSLAVLLAKPLSPMETVNDLDGHLMTFWRVLRERPGDLERACALTPHSRAEYWACYEPAEDELEIARRIWVNLTQGRGGQMRRTGWRFYQNGRSGGASMPEYLAAYCGRIAPAAARLSHVTLECKPALELIGAYGTYPGTLIYADPPYLGALRNRTKTGRSRGPAYTCDLRSDDEHRELLEALLDCRAAVVLSGYASPLYDDLLCTWSRREIATQTGNGGGNRERTEVVWSNRAFPVEQPDLFELEVTG